MPMSCECPAYNADAIRWQSSTSFTRTEGHARSFSNFRTSARSRRPRRSAHVPARRTAASGPPWSRRPVGPPILRIRNCGWALPFSELRNSGLTVRQSARTGYPRMCSATPTDALGAAGSEACKSSSSRSQAVNEYRSAKDTPTSKPVLRAPNVSGVSRILYRHR
jgi:hypothetical protein